MTEKQTYIKYYLIFGIVVLFVILTPHIVRGHLFVSNEIAQSGALLFDMVIAYIFYRMYQKEKKRLEKEKEEIQNNLMESYKFIGSVNRKIDILTEFLGFMEMNSNKSEREIFQSIMKNIVVSAAKSKRGVMRFIDSKTMRTLKEYPFSENGKELRVKVSNKKLMKGTHDFTNDIEVLKSGVDKNDICCFVIYETTKDEKDEKLLKTLIDQANLVYLALNSTCK